MARLPWTTVAITLALCALLHGAAAQASPSPTRTRTPTKTGSGTQTSTATGTPSGTGSPSTTPSPSVTATVTTANVTITSSSTVPVGTTVAVASLTVLAGATYTVEGGAAISVTGDIVVLGTLQAAAGSVLVVGGRLWVNGSLSIEGPPPAAGAPAAAPGGEDASLFVGGDMLVTGGLSTPGGAVLRVQGDFMLAVGGNQAAGSYYQNAALVAVGGAFRLEGRGFQLYPAGSLRADSVAVNGSGAALTLGGTDGGNLTVRGNLTISAGGYLYLGTNLRVAVGGSLSACAGAGDTAQCDVHLTAAHTGGGGVGGDRDAFAVAGSLRVGEATFLTLASAWWGTSPPSSVEPYLNVIARVRVGGDVAIPAGAVLRVDAKRIPLVLASEGGSVTVGSWNVGIAGAFQLAAEAGDVTLAEGSAVACTEHGNGFPGWAGWPADESWRGDVTHPWRLPGPTAACAPWPSMPARAPSR
jgi:hypothetical protein